jgi:hypothetical protein
MGGLSQKGGPIELVIVRDYKKHWPRLVDTSCFATDKLFLMKTVFHPGQFLCGQADLEAVGTKMRGVKRRLTLGTGSRQGPQHHRPGDPGRRRRRRTRRRGGGVTCLQEAERKAEAARAKQQGEEAEAEPSEANQAATEETGRGEKEGSTERFVRRRTAKEELEESAPPAAGETSAAAAEEVQQVRKKGKPAPPVAGETSEAAAVKPERLSRPDKPAPSAAGGTSAAAADKSERPCGKGKLTPSAAGETGEAAVNKPEQVSRPGKPALPAAAADAAERLSKLAGYSYKIPRRISPIRKCYLENFQTLPATLDGCIVRALETTQERFFFDYNRTHFKLQRKREERKSYSD